MLYLTQIIVQIPTLFNFGRENCLILIKKMYIGGNFWENNSFLLYPNFKVLFISEILHLPL